MKLLVLFAICIILGRTEAQGSNSADEAGKVEHSFRCSRTQKSIECCMNVKALKPVCILLGLKRNQLYLKLSYHHKVILDVTTIVGEHCAPLIPHTNLIKLCLKTMKHALFVEPFIVMYEGCLSLRVKKMDDFDLHCFRVDTKKAELLQRGNDSILINFDSKNDAFVFDFDKSLAMFMKSKSNIWKKIKAIFL